VSGIEAGKQKTSIASFAFTVFDNHIETIDQLLRSLDEK
jgi:hypothetical protein